MAIIQVNLTDTINTNTLAEQVGDIALLDTSGPDSSAVSGINALDSDMGRQANLNYKDSNGTFLTLVDAINRIVDSDGNIGGSMDSDSILNNMIADDQIDSNHLIDSAIFGAKFEAVTVLKIFASNGTELRKLYAPSIFDHDSAIAFATNPWV